MSTRAGDLVAFVPNGESRKDTAVLLVGTADEYGIDQRSIQATPGGFWITEELATLIYDEPEEPKTKPTKKTSGNRAGKSNKNSKEE